MCQRADCPLAPKCYRFLAIPSEFMQSWASYDPKDGGCDSFWFATGSYRTRTFEQAVADLGQISATCINGDADGTTPPAPQEGPLDAG